MSWVCPYCGSRDVWMDATIDARMNPNDGKNEIAGEWQVDD